MATLTDLVSIRSQLMLGLEAYLRAFVRLDVRQWPASAFLNGRSLVDLYQWPDVERWDRLDEAARRQRQQADRRGEFAPEEPRDRREAWLTVRPTVARAVILGRPGEGKTTLTQLTCRAVADEAWQVITHRSQPLSALELPIWLTVRDVLRAGSITAAVGESCRLAVADALHRYYPAEGISPVPAATFLSQALSRASTWLFLDALDERLPDRRDTTQALYELGTLPCHVVVTSRPYGYERTDIPWGTNRPATEFVLAPLTGDQQRAFVAERWFVGDAAGAERVIALIKGHPHFGDMTINGLLLTLTCATAERDPDLPATTHRVDLYDRMVRNIVSRAHKANPVRDQVEIRNRLQVLGDLAWRLFPLRPGEKEFNDDEWDDAATEACEARGLDRAWRTRLEHDISEAGLLVSRTDGWWGFLHRTFLEYLAATGLVRQGVPATVDAIVAHAHDEQWREVLVFAVQHLARVQRKRDEAGAVVSGVLAQAGVGMAAMLMGEAVAEVSAEAEAETPVIPADVVEHRLRPALVATMTDDTNVLAPVRVRAGRALGRFGDRRFRHDAWNLPVDGTMIAASTGSGQRPVQTVLGFIRIPAGPFWMGSNPLKDPYASEYETWDQVRLMYDFYISRWPVTVAQMRAFVEAQAELARLGLPSCHIDDSACEGLSNHPAVVFKLDDAVAYCAWLTETLRDWGGTPEPLRGLLREGLGDGRRWQVTLPSEAEWEKAARSVDGRVYPWGNNFDRNRANCWGDEALEARGIHGPSPVGCFPRGASPYGVEELSGNVWEWTRSRHQYYPYDPTDQRREALNDHDSRVIRGGSYLDSPWAARAAYRSLARPGSLTFIGFRVVISPFRP